MSVTTLRETDFSEWCALWRQYLAFNGGTEVPDAQYQNTFLRILAKDGDTGAFVIREPDDAGKIVGLSHYVMQPSLRRETPNCHLSDLFVDQSARRRGYGKKLIMATAEAARKLQCGRLSWVADKDNVVARKLYDSIASCEHVSYRMLL